MGNTLDFRNARVAPSDLSANPVMITMNSEGKDFGDFVREAKDAAEELLQAGEGLPKPFKRPVTLAFVAFIIFLIMAGRPWQ